MSGLPVSPETTHCANSYVSLPVLSEEGSAVSGGPGD